MAFGNHAEMGSQSADKVRPAATVDGNTSITPSKKATKLNMSISHRFGTEYSISAVMNGFRGDKDASRELHGDLNSRDYTPSETPKKGTFGSSYGHMAVGG